MRQQAAASIRSLSSCSWPGLNGQRLPLRQIGLRWMQIYATPTSSGPAADQLDDIDTQKPTSQPDARFEVLGAPFSLLSVQLSASQNLLTRRGTLVALSGKPENVVSKLSLLSPFSRTIGGIPFLYQSITSTSPITALITTKSPLTSFAVVHLDGRLDWIVSQRDGLLAWTGQSLSVSPKLNLKLAISHWGNNHVTGRGLLGLVGRGQIYQISLKSGEEYVVHPSNVVAYSVNQNPPQPYRFKSTSLKLQIPSIMSWLPDTRFTREVRKTSAWKFLANMFFTLRTWARRTVWGDRLFLHFRGPITILLQTRGSRLSDSLTARDVNEIADAPTGKVSEVITLNLSKEGSRVSSITETPRTVQSKNLVEEKPVKMTYVTVGTDKKVRFGVP